MCGPGLLQTSDDMQPTWQINSVFRKRGKSEYSIRGRLFAPNEGLISVETVRTLKHNA
jgi:hypothetical protein